MNTDPSYRSAHNRAQYGSIVTVNPGQPGQISIPAHEEECSWTIEAQASATPLSLFFGSGFIQLYITYTIAEAQFTKVAGPLGLSILRIPIFARQISVRAVWMASPGVPFTGSNPNNPIQVSLAIAKGVPTDSAPTDGYAPQWQPPLLINDTATHIVLPTIVGQLSAYGTNNSFGVLLASRVLVESMPTGVSPFYVGVYDRPATGALISGFSVPLWHSKPLTVNGDWDAFDDEFAPCQRWSIGLAVAGSSTPDVFTTLSASPTFVIDLKLGQ